MDEAPRTVLVVDRDTPSAQARRHALTERGFVCAHASTAIEAIQLTMDTVFSAAIVELELSGESGLSVLQHLRGDERPLPVLVLTTDAPAQKAVEALKLGADDVVPESISVDELHARLERRFELASRLAVLLDQRDELLALSTTDGLTQVANHRAFQERLREEFRRAQRYDDPMALILMDIDHFKAVNDTHGHQIGDEVLKAVAKALKGAVRETDFIARYGGEEFAVVLPKTHLAGALTVAERMSQSLKATRSGVDGAIRVTGSFGVSGFPGRGVTTAEQLLKTADDALYRSKREGRNKISLFQSSLYVARG
ncbi:MAG: diguanylate cyclase [Archangium sp.]|nr:diguanylate cyclase [Archangium sp.]